MTTEERLEKLERELARAKQSNRRLVLTGAGLLVGLFALLVAGRSMTSVAQGQEKAAEKTVIKANKFILEDENGKTRAMLHVDEFEVELALFDKNGNLPGGKPRATLSAFEGGTELSLRDENFKSRTTLSAFNFGSKRSGGFG